MFANSNVYRTVFALRIEEEREQYRKQIERIVNLPSTPALAVLAQTRRVWIGKQLVAPREQS